MFEAWDWSQAHPCAPSIDHIIKVADGGCSHRANLRLTHFYCNTDRDRVGTHAFADAHYRKVVLILRENGYEAEPI